MTGASNHAAMLERLDAYAALRDAGVLPADAARQFELSMTSGYRYERWYRQRCGLPARAGLSADMQSHSLPAWPS
jgi:hypothetical protein